METEESRLSHQGLDHQIAVPTSGIPALDVVRALHQTVISLRSALDSSRKELLRLRKIVGDFQGENYAGAIERLSLENHVLRRKLLDGHKKNSSNDVHLSFTTSYKSKSPTTTILIQETSPLEKIEKRTMEEESDNACAKVEDVTHDLLDAPERDLEDISCLSVSESDLQNLTPETKHDDSENESEELNDIELIFTTDETCRDIGLQDDLVSITEPEQWQSLGSPGLLECSKSGDAAHAHDREAAGSSLAEEAISSQNSSIDQEDNVDISKCGVIEDPDQSPVAETSRGNGPVASTSSNKRKGSVPLRPVINRGYGVRQESGAQTDISALPGQWRSESYLAHKVSHTFTTLPSKFTFPAGVARRLKVSDKTREARRVLLSDISFTSMVPELSKSDDHLCHDSPSGSGGRVITLRSIGYRTQEALRRESLGLLSIRFRPHCNQSTGLSSPCECHSQNDVRSRRRGSSFSIPSPVIEVAEVPIRRHSWRPVVNSFARSTPSSMPTTPTRNEFPTSGIPTPKNSPEKASSTAAFRVCPLNRGSLPNFQERSSGGNASGVPSTDSLLDQAEEYLKESLESMMTISTRDRRTPPPGRRRERNRRVSESDLLLDWASPHKSKPYLPKTQNDLKINQMVKVISPDGKIVQGRIKYVGPVPDSEEIFVGIILPLSIGTSDGLFRGRRYFLCRSRQAIFVPFRKVVLAWTLD